MCPIAHASPEPSGVCQLGLSSTPRMPFVFRVLLVGRTRASRRDRLEKRAKQLVATVATKFASGGGMTLDGEGGGNPFSASCVDSSHRETETKVAAVSPEASTTTVVAETAATISRPEAMEGTEMDAPVINGDIVPSDATGLVVPAGDCTVVNVEATHLSISGMKRSLGLGLGVVT